MSGLIAVSLKSVRQFTAASHSGANYIELRTDFFSIAQIVQLAKRSPLPIILTIKRPLQLPARLPPTIKYIDVDYKAPAALLHSIPPGPKLIQSWHDYTATPPLAKLQAIIKQVRRLGYLPKIATTMRTVDDLVVIAHLQKTYGKQIIAIGMGELGIMTRLYNKSWLTFAALTPTTGTAPGQITVAQLRSGTQLYGLIGDDIAHSLSPQLHNHWFKQHNLPHHYQLWQTQNLRQFMEVFNFFQLPGASITKPYKKTIITYCQKLDRHAKAIGAVNTLVRHGQTLYGYNTDWLGVQQALGRSLHNARVLILGNGGAARAVAYAAKQARAKKITRLTHAHLPTIQTNFDVVVNATPVTNRVLVPPTSLRKKIVLDCNYSRPTTLLRTARQQNAQRVLNGLPMLRTQAQAQFWLWTHSPAD